jgi:iron complex outermembrane receptor protein
MDGEGERVTRSERGGWRIVAVGVLSCAVLLPGGSVRVAAAGQQVGAMTGTVAASANGRPVAGAVVTVEGTALFAVTNAVGRFVLEGVAVGSRVLMVQAPGFLDLRVLSVQVGPETPVSLRIQLDLTPNYLERVQVTASKAPLSIGEVAAQADIVDRSTIEERGDQRLTDAIAHVPGVMVSTQAGSFESVTLRGLPRDGNEFTSTLLLIDGVPQTDSRNSARVVNLPITDASSIEVVRGPNSALYGRTAVGGSINVRTADPTPDHQTGFDMTGGEFGLFKGAAKASGPISDWGGYYVSAASERNSGFYTGPFDFTVDQTALFAKVTFVPDKKSFGSISANRVLSAQSLPTNVPIINGQFLSDIDPQFDRLTDLNVEGVNYRQNESRFTANYTRQFADPVRLVNVFGYRQIQYQFIDSGDITGAPFDLAANTLTQYPFELQTDEDIFYGESRLEIDADLGGMETSVIAGGSYEYTSGFGAGNLMYTDADTFGWPLNYLDPAHPAKSDWEFFRFGGNDYNVGIAALFGQVSVEPTRRIRLTAGGRYDRMELDNTLTFRDGNPVVEDTFDAFSPKVSGTFKLLPDVASADVNLYGQYSQAFLPPRRPSGLRPGDDDIRLNPEDIDNYETGVKASVLDGKVSFEGTYFWMKRDGIVHSVRQGPFFVPTNAGEHRYKGVELGTTWTASPEVSFYVNGAFYRNRFGDFVIESAGGNTVLTGNRLPIAPDRIINGGVVITPSPAVNLRLDVKHVGDVMVDQGNTFELDPYTLVDASISWYRGPTRITLSAHNLLNEEYYWNGDTSRAESADPGAPRQVLLTTSFSFR